MPADDPRLQDLYQLEADADAARLALISLLTERNRAVSVYQDAAAASRRAHAAADDLRRQLVRDGVLEAPRRLQETVEAAV